MSLSRIELIELLGGVVVELDVLRSQFKLGDPIRGDLDEARSELSFYTDKMIRHHVSEGSKSFVELTSSLQVVNDQLRSSIRDISKIASNLQLVAQIIGIADEIVKLIPVSVLFRSHLAS
ncbi:hypothetical protein HX891_19235 [Pseudomonas reactans]|uniref:hypothetical protein n=1 Tax=Pseudomonas reactans TaxID=117680 RepID=UPI0015C08C0C|nr:hypothetical protein [Pseudomonas reactans]NWD82521.1 hypothetical protein [Pseudomonas reactans]